MENIFEKYHIVHIKGCRYYTINLMEQEYNFENTIPYCCIIKSVEILSSSWKGMIVKLCEYLDSINPKERQELLKVENTWGKQKVFSECKKTNFTAFKGIYINTNHTSVHAMWTIQIILNLYLDTLNDCKFIIKRSPSAEPLEIREYAKRKTIDGFKKYLEIQCNKSLENIEGVIKNLEIINKKLLSKITTSYYDIFLFENPTYISNYANKILAYATERCPYTKLQIKTIKKSLLLLIEYIKIQYQENKINFATLSEELNLDDIEDFPDDF